MQAVATLVKGLFGLAVSVIFGGLSILCAIGGIYWMWIAIQIGSFWMFLLGMFPFFWLITAPTGAYSLLFGVPHWVFNWFA